MKDRRMMEYLDVQANTAAPMQRVVMMYDGLVRKLNQAAQCIESGTTSSIETANNTLLTAQQIVLELQVSLDFEKGGEIARSLDELYEYWSFTLSEANVNKASTQILEVIEQVKEVRSGWSVAAKEAIHGQPELC